jgi:NAD(P)-dependent dehydrogenase (short-subunit alcohol dehydrogenase family)
VGHRLLDLAGRRALITGAGRGLGRALAVGFAEAGAEVVICARGRERLDATAELARAHGGGVTVIVADVTVEDDVRRLADEAGAIDILVNNAGGAVYQPWRTVPLDEWHQAFRLNLDAPFRLIQLLAPGMLERGWGRIINIASVYGSIAPDHRYYTPDWDVSSYFATKHGINGLTRYFAPLFARQGVTVNSLSPGGIMTADQDAELAQDDRERLARFADAKVPMGRLGGADDYVGPAVFLASAGSAYVTGQLLVVDGGWSAW